MATATPQIQRLFNNARVKLPGAVDDMLKLEFYNVLNEFFTDSNIWTDSVPLLVDSTTNTYDVEPLDESQITRLMSIYSSANFGRLWVNGSMEIPGTLVLQLTPSQADTYTVTLAKTVIDPVSKQRTGSTNEDPLVYGFPNYPEWVVDKYFQGFIDGLVGRMAAQTSKPYANEKMAVYHLRKFQMYVTTARNESNRKNVYGAQRWTYPQSFRVPAKGLQSFK